MQFCVENHFYVHDSILDKQPISQHFIGPMPLSGSHLGWGLGGQMTQPYSCYTLVCDTDEIVYDWVLSLGSNQATNIRNQITTTESH